MLKLKCLFTTDLHGNIDKYKKLFELIKKEKPKAVFLGGDLFPNNPKISIDDFFNNFFIEEVKKIKKLLKNQIRFFTIMGNDDPRIYEKNFIQSTEEGIIDYVNNKIEKFENFFVVGYSYVPPTPFKLKDWEKYDVSRYVDVGAVSPEEGWRSVEIDKNEIIYSTISDDLKKLTKNLSVEKTIFLFHSPPYDTFLDRAALDEKKVDHTPVDLHIGSIAIRRFIENKHPFLTLHGHVHETVSLTGKWVQKFSKTYSFSACNDGKELAVIIFDTDKLEEANRLLI